MRMESQKKCIKKLKHSSLLLFSNSPKLPRTVFVTLFPDAKGQLLGCNSYNYSKDDTGFIFGHYFKEQNRLVLMLCPIYSNFPVIFDLKYSRRLRPFAGQLHVLDRTETNEFMDSSTSLTDVACEVSCTAKHVLKGKLKLNSQTFSNEVMRPLESIRKITKQGFPYMKSFIGAYLEHPQNMADKLLAVMQNNDKLYGLAKEESEEDIAAKSL